MKVGPYTSALVSQFWKILNLKLLGLQKSAKNVKLDIYIEIVYQEVW
jgi:hypothetical protein